MIANHPNNYVHGLVRGNPSLSHAPLYYRKIISSERFKTCRHVYMPSEELHETASEKIEKEENKKKMGTGQEDQNMHFHLNPKPKTPES